MNVVSTKQMVRLTGLVVLFALLSISVLGQSEAVIEVTGSVVSFDQAFGSVGTDITAQALQEAGIVVGDLVELRMSGHVLEIPVISELFPQLPQSLPGIIVWGNAYIGGWYRNIAAEYDVALGDEIVICLTQKEGYLDEIAAREVDYVESREQCASDEEYANFREVSCGDIAAGVLFRSSHPADGSVKSSYAHALMVEAGVQTIINVGASWNEPEQAFGNSGYYSTRGDEGAVLATNIGLAVTWPHFKTELGRVLRFMIDHAPPYLIHCSLGQDRAGITSAVLAALAGADLQDVIDDYALTFANYYRITPGHLLYPEVVEQLVSKFREMNYGDQVTAENLQSVVEVYLASEVGLSKAEIRTLQSKLSKGPVEDASARSPIDERPDTTTASSDTEPPAAGRIDALFDEAHDEINTISEERASVINAAHPEWYYFGEMAECLSREGYILERGLSQFDSAFLAGFDVVVLATPREALTDSELASLLAFVQDGGGLLVAQDAFPPSDTGSNQIAGLLGAQFREGVLRSEHGDWDPESFGVDAVGSDHPIVQGARVFQMNWGCSIEATRDWGVLFQSKPDTWQDTDGNGRQDAGEPAGPLAVAVATQVGRGRVILVADNAFQQGMWSSNETFFTTGLGWLAEEAADAFPGKEPILDNYEDGDLTSEAGSEWISASWDGGTLTTPIYVAQDGEGWYLSLEGSGTGGIGVETTFVEQDLSSYSGVYVIATISREARLAVCLRNTDADWPSGYRDTRAEVDSDSTGSLRVIRLPFPRFRVETWRRAECADCPIQLDPTRVVGLGIECWELDGALRIYEVGFYADSEERMPRFAADGVDGYAVILEADEYSGDWSDLAINYINRDRIVDLLTGLGWSQENMYIALDLDVTGETVDEAFAWLTDRVTDEDIVLFYVTAHGRYLDESVGLNAILPAHWAALPTERKLLVVDACLAGRFTTPAMYGEFILPDELPETDVPPVRGLVLGACAYNEVTWGGVEEEGLPIIGTVTSYYLCEALTDPSLDSNADGYVAVEEAFPALYEKSRAYMLDVVFQVPEFLAGLVELFPEADPTDYPHPELLDAYDGSLILDLSYYGHREP